MTRRPLLYGLLLSLASLIGCDAGNTCGEGTALVGSECRPYSVDASGQSDTAPAECTPAGIYQCFAKDQKTGDVLKTWDTEVSQLSSCGDISPCLYLRFAPITITGSNGYEYPFGIADTHSTSFDTNTCSAVFAGKEEYGCPKDLDCFTGAPVPNIRAGELTVTIGNSGMSGHLTTKFTYIGYFMEGNGSTVEKTREGTFDIECNRR